MTWITTQPSMSFEIVYKLQPLTISSVQPLSWSPAQFQSTLLVRSIDWINNNHYISETTSSCSSVLLYRLHPKYNSIMWFLMTENYVWYVFQIRQTFIRAHDLWKIKTANIAYTVWPIINDVNPFREIVEPWSDVWKVDGLIYCQLARSLFINLIVLQYIMV